MAMPQGISARPPGVVSGAVGSDPSSFYRGTVGGVGLFEGKVPASGGSDLSSAFMIRGMGLALGVWRMLEVELFPELWALRTTL